jgi:hypothetical protein
LHHLKIKLTLFEYSIYLPCVDGQYPKDMREFRK